MGATLERDERVLTGASGGSRHLREGFLSLFKCSTHVAFLLSSRQCLLWHELRSALLESFLLFRSILRPASKGPEAHEGVGEDRTPGHSQQFGGIAPQRYIGNQG